MRSSMLCRSDDVGADTVVLDILAQPRQGPLERGVVEVADPVDPGRFDGAVEFENRKVLYAWIGGTRRDWRGQGHFRALTEQQEVWALENGFDEILVKTKNRFYEMRGTLDHLRFDVVKYEPHADNRESKVYLGKKLGQAVLDAHRSMKTVVTVGQ